MTQRNEQPRPEEAAPFDSGREENRFPSDGGTPEDALQAAETPESGEEARPVAAEEEDSQARREGPSRVEIARKLYPELRTLPDEIVMDVVNGSGFLSAYAAYRTRRAEVEAARLRREMETLRRERDVFRRAPVRGVTGGGATRREQDDFLAGFDADAW